MHQKLQKTFFVTSPKFEIMIKKKSYFIVKKIQKSPFKHFRFARSKSSVKGLMKTFENRIPTLLCVRFKLQFNRDFSKLSTKWFTTSRTPQSSV
jgi:hypothetical protein